MYGFATSWCRLCDIVMQLHRLQQRAKLTDQQKSPYSLFSCVANIQVQVCCKWNAMAHLNRRLWRNYWHLGEGGADCMSTCINLGLAFPTSNNILLEKGVEWPIWHLGYFRMCQDVSTAKLDWIVRPNPRRCCISLIIYLQHIRK